MDIGDLRTRALAYQSDFDAAKEAAASPDWPWYPYGSLTNFIHLDGLLTGANRELLTPTPGARLLDIGAADGDTAFFLEREGYAVDVIDYGPTNYNTCRGLRALKAHLGSAVTVTELDLDAQFALPDEHYDVALVLGLLYHLKNPFFLLERLAKSVDRILLSTRVTRFNRGGDVAQPAGVNPTVVDLADVPVAYLVDPFETNNDSTNYWMFTEAGLRRLLTRTGWVVEDWMTVGAVGASDPASATGDERAFCLARRHDLR